MLTSRTGTIAAAIAATALLLGAGASQAIGGEFSLGLGANSNATAKDVGLPFYPGSRLLREDKDDEPAAKVWAAFGAYGLKIAAVKLETGDAPARVAPFYANALNRYGRVLNCSAGMPRPPHADKHSNRLDCGDDRPKPGEILLKAGVKNDFHVVGIEPHGRGSRIALVYIQVRGGD
jgi:hypothetical protein